MKPVPNEMVALANRLAEAARQVIRPRFRGQLQVELKSDHSPVTDVDRDVELRIREIIADSYPDHGAMGEEFPPTNPGAEFVWIIDPIDGTSSFVNGVPLFSTLIALRHRERFILGLMDQPITSERWVGVAGRGASFNGRAIRTRSCARLGDAVIAIAGPDDFQGNRRQSLRAFEASSRSLVYGADSYHYALLAMGVIDAVLFPDLSIHDVAAPTVIIEGAGGSATDWQGRQIDPDSGGCLLAVGDSRLRDQIASLLSTPRAW